MNVYRVTWVTEPGDVWQTKALFTRTSIEAAVDAGFALYRKRENEGADMREYWESQLLQLVENIGELDDHELGE